MASTDLSGAIRSIGQIQAITTQAIPRALNRAIVSARTVMVPAIAADMGLKSADVKDRIRTENATADVHVARLHARVQRIPLIEFKATGPQPSRGRGRGVSYRIGSRGRGRLEHAFIATMRSGHRGVFRRVGAGDRRSQGAWSKNLPVVQLQGPSIARVFTRHKDVGLARGREALVKNLQSEIRFALRRSG